MNSTVIYNIYLAVCKINGKPYVGFTGDFEGRKRQHHYDSRKSKCKFYKAIRKYGWDNFEWSIIYQSLDRKHTAHVMESFFITEYDSYKNGYNETLGGIGGNKVKEWIVMDPEGKTFSITNLKEFCRKQNLEFSSMLRVSMGKYNHCNKWQCRNADDNTPFIGPQEMQKIYRKYEYILLSPLGETFTTDNLKSFCYEFKLGYSSMRDVLTRLRKTHKGWTVSRKL